jgi:predicted enzyme related to lactoylglutathione lyase
MPRPVHFELSADQPERLSQFYSDIFGWKFQKWDGPMEYWMVLTGDGKGIDGGLMRRQGQPPATINTVEVPKIDETVRQIESRGGKTIAPKMAIPGIGWLAYCQDPEGTTFGVMEADEGAA